MDNINKEPNSNGQAIEGYLGINIKMSSGDLPEAVNAAFSGEPLKNKNSCSLYDESEQSPKVAEKINQKRNELIRSMGGLVCTSLETYEISGSISMEELNKIAAQNTSSD